VRVKTWHILIRKFGNGFHRDVEGLGSIQGSWRKTPGLFRRFSLSRSTLPNWVPKAVLMYRKEAVLDLLK